MNHEIAEALSLDERATLTLDQLVEMSELPAEELRALVDYGALAPVDPAAATWTFTATWVVVARTAGRLRRDFGLPAGWNVSGLRQVRLGDLHINFV